MAGDHELSSLELLPPIVDPRHIWCLAINYAEHIKEVNAIGIQRDRPQKPALFMRYADTLVGHGRPILCPLVSDNLDYEGELAVVIGRSGRNIAESDAMGHVAGYSCFNDASIRDWQFHTRQIAPGKNFFATGAFGPWLVTKDEIADPHNLSISTKLNGAQLQVGSTGEMLFDIPAFISYVSAMLPLYSGDVLCTGTPSGVGFSRRPPVFMKPGDEVVVEVQGIGTLTNPVALAKADDGI
jgi:2-keto-4-pentenoate hydratase/2-oxohepta-3-ene-1,7-dioic acid hydratase in catechol pathway